MFIIDNELPEHIATYIVDKELPEECEVFLVACGSASQWKPGEPEPTVSYRGQRITISEACKLVLDRTDLLVPEGFYENDPTTPTYAEAAQDALVSFEYHRERFAALAAQSS